MPSSESEDETRPAGQPHTTATATKATKTAGEQADEPAWPPAEAKPEESGPTAEVAANGKPEAAATKAEAEPKQEMGLSESTLHWLVDSDKPLEPPTVSSGAAHHEARQADLEGRKRAAIVLGGLLLIGLVVAIVLHVQAGNQTNERANADAAAILTHRAETALAQGRRNEAMELAHLAIITDPQAPNAYIVAGNTAQAAGRPVEARDAFRKYLELSPVGPHAQEARTALAALPQ